MDSCQFLLNYTLKVRESLLLKLVELHTGESSVVCAFLIPSEVGGVAFFLISVDLRYMIFVLLRF